jgi:hypothetical protein
MPPCNKNSVNETRTRRGMEQLVMGAIRATTIRKEAEKQPWSWCRGANTSVASNCNSSGFREENISRKLRQYLLHCVVCGMLHARIPHLASLRSTFDLSPWRMSWWLRRLADWKGVSSSQLRVVGRCWICLGRCSNKRSVQQKYTGTMPSRANPVNPTVVA